jgi:dynein heavy chain
LDNLEMMVGGFGVYDTLEKYLEYANNVDNVEAKLLESIELARVFNSREFLIGKEVRDYSRLQQMTKDFLPY